MSLVTTSMEHRCRYPGPGVPGRRPRVTSGTVVQTGPRCSGAGQAAMRVEGSSSAGRERRCARAVARWRLHAARAGTPRRLPQRGTPERPGPQACRTASSSISMRISRETTRPPPSSGRFQVRPQSSRSTVPAAVKTDPVAAPRVGGVAEVLGLQGHRPGDAAQGQFPREHSPGALPAGRAGRERRRRDGCSTSKKSAERRCSSRASLPDSTEVMSMVTSTVVSPGCSATSIAPDRPVNRPRTLVSMKWRPMKASSV